MDKKSYNRYWIKGFAVFGVVFLWATACLAQMKPVVKVNDTTLTELDLGEAIEKLLPALSFHGGLTTEQRENYRDKAMDLMINDELLYQEALAVGLKADEKAVDDIVKSRVKKLGGNKGYREALKAAGITDKQYRQRLAKKMLVGKIMEVEVAEKALVSDEEAKKLYEENKGGYMRPEAWRLRHILVSVDPAASSEEWEARGKRAEEALEKIKGGTDMAAVAWDYSDDPYRVKGGDLGLLHSGRLMPELEVVIKTLGVGDVSGVIRTIYGYHIIKLEEKTQPQQLGYEDVAQKIKRELGTKKSKELEGTLIERLRAKARIEVY